MSTRYAILSGISHQRTKRSFFGTLKRCTGPPVKRWPRTNSWPLAKNGAVNNLWSLNPGRTTGRSSPSCSSTPLPYLYHQRLGGLPQPGAQGHQDQRGLYKRYGPAQAGLSGHKEHREKMDLDPVELEPGGPATLY